MAAAAGILTATGGRTAHAAVVARQLAKVCLVGCAALEIDLATRTCRVGARTLAEGDAVTLDGGRGAVCAGALPILRGAPAVDLDAIARLRHAAEQGDA